MSQFDDSTQNDVQAINLTIEQAQHSVSLGLALDRLDKNPDFQNLILGDYLREQPIRLGHLVADPAMQSKEQQKRLMTELRAVGDFLSYLRNTKHRADMAAEAIRVNEQELEHIYTANPETQEG
jgi:hypothetical protein